MRFALPLRLALSIAFAVTLTSAIWAYTPNDPIVKQMVQRGVEYLERLQDGDFSLDARGFSGSAGEAVLVAYAHHKCRHDPDNPVVRRGLRMALSIVDALEAGHGDDGLKRNYEMAVCVMLLADLDAERYRSELRILQRHLLEGQYANGAFGYPHDRDGDVSQTQYAMLAVWTLDRNGFMRDYDRVSRAANWLFRVQDAGGGWPYKGKDPGIGKPRRLQSKVDMSMSLAGASSVLIAGDTLRTWGDHGGGEDTGIPGLPKAVKVYKERGDAGDRQRPKLSVGQLESALKSMEHWRQQHPYKRTSAIDWYYYQIYTLERYESFAEIAGLSPKSESPDWYNLGVDQLRRYQGSDGGWTDRSLSRGPVSTAFALLFLVRSTRQSVMMQMNAGTVQGGGNQLPKVTTNIRVEGATIKDASLNAEITSLLDALDVDAAMTDENDDLVKSLADEPDPMMRQSNFERLERLLRGSSSWRCRRFAARVLGSSDALNAVPALIFALSDPDDSVRLYARDGLRLVSRKFDGFAMPDHPTPKEVREAQQSWRQWYRTLNPKHVFLAFDL